MTKELVRLGATDYETYLLIQEPRFFRNPNALYRLAPNSWPPAASEIALAMLQSRSRLQRHVTVR